MVRKVVLAIAACAMFSMANAPDILGAQWYPFYGYRRPSYLDEQRVVTVQPATAQVSTAHYPPAQDSATAGQLCASQVSTAYYPPTQDTVVPAQTTGPRQYSGSRWYPFYGNRRPSYLDR